MWTIKKGGLIVGGVCLAFVSFASNVSACLCKSGSPMKTVQRLRKSSDFIFAGRVLNVSVTKLGNSALLQVYRQWKGKLALEKVTVHSRGGCFVSFETDMEYLVYGSIDVAGNLETDVCMRSGLLRNSDEDLSILGPPIYEQSKKRDISIRLPLLTTDFNSMILTYPECS